MTGLVLSSVDAYLDCECELIHLFIFLLLFNNAASLVGLVTRLWGWVAEELGFDPGLGQEILVFP
jgi:hypothetical protein